MVIYKTMETLILTNSSDFNFTYSFRNLIPSGTTIDWVVRYRRSSPASYMWAPAKLYNPSSPSHGRVHSGPEVSQAVVEL